MEIIEPGEANPTRQCGGCGARLKLDKEDIKVSYIFGWKRSIGMPPSPTYYYVCPTCKTGRHLPNINGEWRDYAYNKAFREYKEKERVKALADRKAWDASGVGHVISCIAKWIKGQD